VPDISLSFADFAAIGPELFLTAAAIGLLMIGVLLGETSSRKVTFGAILAFLITLVMLLASPHADAGPVFGGLIRIDLYGGFMKALVMLGAALSLFVGYSFFEREGIAKFEYPVVMMFSTVGMFIMISASDLMSLYVGLELQSLALYVIAASHRDNMKSTEAGLKYFVLGALSSGMLLYGASMIYGFSGTTSFSGIANALGTGTPAIGVVIGLVFVIAGLAFKISVVPFHMWTPDVYEGAPTPVTTFFAVSPKVAAMALLVRTLTVPFGAAIGQWQQVIVFVALASMFLGSLAAINQTNIKRLMAYSSIANMGYALVGLAAGKVAGVSGVMVYMAIYIATTMATFGCILSMRRGSVQVERISDLAGLSRTNPMLAFALMVTMFSTAGIPPLAGFFAKLYVFEAAIESGLYTLAIVGILTSVIGAFYYLRIIKVMYFDAPAEKFEPVDRNIALVTALGTVLTLLFFLAPGPIVTSATAAAAALLGQ
jgi:NADH-quinone oxidoreductase subunit N